MPQNRTPRRPTLTGAGKLRQKFKKGDWWKIAGVIIIVFAIPVLGALLTYRHEEKSLARIHANKCVTVCTIIDRGRQRHSASYTYYAEGRQWEGKSIDPENEQVGDHYIVYYQCSDPDNEIIVPEEKLFIEAELRDTASVEASSIVVTDSIVEFSYSIQEYGPVVTTQNCSKLLRQKIANGQARVVYLQHDPVRAILM